MSLISISHLSFRYDGTGHDMFTDTSLQLDTDWKLGLIGRNGKGKTTLLRLLAGGLDHSGSISASTAFEYFPFPVTQPSRTARQVILSLCPLLEEEGEGWKVDRELAWLQADPDVADRSFSSLSNGEKTKVMLAALFLKPYSFLLIDEPTNHLDAHGRRQVAAYLQRKRGFILISHDRHFLNSCIDHVLSINRCTIEVMRGDYDTWKRNRDYRDNFELARQDKLQKDIRTLTESARQASAWSDQVEKSKYKPKGGKVSRFQQAGINRGAVGHKAAKMMKRSKSLEDRRKSAVEEKSLLLRDLETAEPLKIHPLVHHSRTLVEAVDLTLWHNHGAPVFQGLSFSLVQGERIALRGPNGCGKSSLLGLVTTIPAAREGGMGPSFSGILRVASRLIVSHVEQDLGHLSGTLETFCREQELDENLFRAILSRLDLPTGHYWREDLRTLSDGQRKKAALARSLSQQAHVYVWDEPLNFMDILAREQIEDLILEYCPTMLLVEHDQTFVDTVATSILEM